MALLRSGTRIYGNTSVDTFITVGSNVSISGANSSTSNITGALVISNGGLGVVGNVYTGSHVITGAASNGITFVDGTTQVTSPAATASYANSAYTQANTATTNAATADSKAVTAGSYANSAYTQANTATNNAAGASLYANGAFVAANTADSKAVTSGSYANSAYTQANTATNNAAGASLYANGAFVAANTADSKAVTAGSYANSAYTQANTATTNAATADSKAVSAGSYANSAFTKANGAVQTGFTTFAANGTNITPASNNDTITITPGTGIAISACTTTKTITVSSSGSGGGGGAVTFAATPPASGNTAGDIWIDSNDGTEYTYISDGTSSQWVDFTTPTVNTYSILGGSAGAIPYQQSASNTVFLNAGTAGQVLSITSGAVPVWVSQSTFSIATSQLTGTISASQLASTAVTPATYGGASTMTSFTVDQQGRITAAANITPSIANTQITGVMTASQLAATAVTTGTYGGASAIPVITVDQQGRLTSAANVAVSTGITISDDTTTATSLYPTFTSATSGSISAASVTSTKLTFVPSTGTLSATVVTATSDENYKNNIVTITNPIDTIMKLRGVEYNWIDNGQKGMGVIAQEVEKILPYLVHETENGKSVMYSNMIGLLIEAIKEQQKQIDDLRGRINGD